jgi:hypothetical protein
MKNIKFVDQKADNNVNNHNLSMENEKLKFKGTSTGGRRSISKQLMPEAKDVNRTETAKGTRTSVMGSR